jgi:hypothetical protein
MHGCSRAVQADARCFQQLRMGVGDVNGGERHVVGE